MCTLVFKYIQFYGVYHIVVYTVINYIQFMSVMCTLENIGVRLRHSVHKCIQFFEVVCTLVNIDVRFGHRICMTADQVTTTIDKHTHRGLKDHDSADQKPKSTEHMCSVICL